MGYDMYTVQGPDDAEREAIAAAQKHIATLIRPFDLPEGDKRTAAETAWADAWKARDAAERSYFRLNVWGMSAAVELMHGMGLLSDVPNPEWPKLADFGLEDWPDDPEDCDGDERTAAEAKLTDRQRAFLAASNATRDHDSGTDCIPADKFCSNDGWLVTPRQIETTLNAYRFVKEQDKAEAAKARPWWPLWIAWLGHAQERGGFRVH